jgi:hypothetical protein
VDASKIGESKPKVYDEFRDKLLKKGNLSFVSRSSFPGESLNPFAAGPSTRKKFTFCWFATLVGAFKIIP